METVTDLSTLAGLCGQLGAAEIGELHAAEQQLLQSASEAPEELVAQAIELIRAGDDPLGDAYCRLISPTDRRPQGQTYTPKQLVDFMVSWAQKKASPQRVVDPGAGSGRFLLAAGRAFPDAELVGVELDPLSALMLRANASASGLGGRVRVEVADYRRITLERISGRTLFIGNPPYVRHHLIAPAWKAWFKGTAAARGLTASSLAGLHAHFFLATAEHGAPGDYGAYVTSSEWLDVNYGKLVRDLLLNGLGGESVHLLSPEAAPFPDAQTTAAVTCFELGTQAAALRVRAVKDLESLSADASGTHVPREQARASSRWSTLVASPQDVPEGFVELGELFSVHRGAVTGANSFWITATEHPDLPAHLLSPAVTRARELFEAGPQLTRTQELKRLITLPKDLSQLSEHDRSRVERFLKDGKRQRIHEGYIASHRSPWWSIQVKDPAPVLATYMARRPPAFVHNTAAVRHINIAHGLYPRQPWSPIFTEALVRYLRESVTLGQGRTYAGGLTKFEPREMARIPVPGPELIEEELIGAHSTPAGLHR